jgi:hypothetical protein
LSAGAIVVFPPFVVVGAGLGTVTAATGGAGRNEGFGIVSFAVFAAVEAGTAAEEPTAAALDWSGVSRRQRSDTSARFNKLDNDPIRRL